MISAEDEEEFDETAENFSTDDTWSWTRQTMNYVGQLAGQVFVQVKELYRGLNPATLSGCIDVIVVRQPDGSLQCSPFHVRFGKMGVLRSLEKVEVVPSYLATSPILSDGALLMSSSLLGKGSGPPIQTLGSTGAAGETGNGMMKKRRKRRRKVRADSVRREDSGDYSEDEDMISRDVLRDETTVAPGSSFKQSGIYTRSDGDWSPIQSPGNSRPTSPKSDSELLTKPSDAAKQDPAMHWAWGELPQAAKPSFLQEKPSPPSVCPVTIPVSESTHFRVITHETEQSGPCAEISALTLMMPQETNGDTVGMEAMTAGGVAAQMSEMEETMPLPPGKTDSPSKRKDKRSCHLGSDGIYLDDITDLEPEVAALYFPKSDGVVAVRSVSDPGPHGSSMSPQSLSSGGDSGVDSYCDPLADMPTITISLCGGLNDNREITKEQFHEKIISYQQFSENPSIIDDPNLVVKIGSKYYNWSSAAPLMLALQAFQKPLPKVAVENIMKEKMPKKGGRWWFSWRGRNSSAKSDSLNAGACGYDEQDGKMSSRHKEDSSSSDEDHRAALQSSAPGQSEPGLSPGVSDTLGHILPTLGKDWNHQGIAQLYHKVSQNGYKFLYCSARAIGMADMTRGYLHWVNERGTMLPIGPVLLSPSSLFSALHREVIEKKPEKFKVECLNDIKNLFYPNTQPFYAAFGNRPTDVYSYKEVGVPLNRIFTVNPKGELVQEHAKTNISSYVRLGEVVDHVFPLKTRSSSSDFPCSDTYSHFTYWRQQLPRVEPQGTTPPQSPLPSS
ncbi:hypothetical protein F7725_019485 [Dissostichus mawsoni]|uniref:phosphatidate phosphatase n=1 Tax=Dissostichus mawsoni TaxID=36200 RepID=A0A7J5YJU7_DISMA|nr:hypothetical protein F7725_019485 [Dissostichus mawsoni]